MKDNNLGSTLMYRYINNNNILQDYEGLPTEKRIENVLGFTIQEGKQGKCK
jgi:hypothetical protein